MALAASTCLASFAVAGPALAQAAYPNKPITLIVPAAAGGPTDTVARLIAESMTKTFGQTVVVENVGGAGGTIGMAKVARARTRRLHDRGLAHRPGHRPRPL